ncbi:hypothetical protein [Flagellimonas sp. S3867]|uniref:hypothetical protein n=1 Tax=Flagellimonas sp. S3867 TaxID=2768063 RepID=UPI00168800AE|nr:hypothetical protein [Flagellimonas sp. S3867]
MKTWIWLAVAFCLAGCSSDDQLQEDTPASKKGSFVAVGEDLNKVFQYNYNAISDSGITFDLTQELGIPPTYLTLGQKEDLLSFYTFSTGAFSLATKDISTGAVNTFPSFYNNIADRSVAWGVNNETTAFFAYFGPAGSRNLGILAADLDGSNQIDANVDFNVERTLGPMLYDGILYISYRDLQGNYKLTIYDTNLGTVGTILNFGATAFSFLITENGDLAIFKNEVSPTLEIYDSKSLAFIENVTLDINLGFSPGPVDDAFLIDDKIYFNVGYPQPSRFATGPAIYDLNSQELAILDLFALTNEVEEEIGQTLQITTQVYHKSEKVFLTGYGTVGDDVLGGVFQASTDGKLLENITLPFFPTYFVRN